MGEFRRARHAIFMLMVIGRYGYGDHVSDPAAFVARLRKFLR